MSRPQLNPYRIITNGDMSGDVTSIVTICLKLSQLSYEISWTGTPTGYFQAEVSDSYSLYPNGSINNAGVWNALPLSAVPGPSGADGNGTIMLNQMPGYAIRLRYLHTSGSGTLNVYVNGKVA